MRLLIFDVLLLSVVFVSFDIYYYYYFIIIMIIIINIASAVVVDVVNIRFKVLVEYFPNFTPHFTITTSSCLK